MSGNGVSMGRYRAMMGEINQNMPQITNNAFQGMGMGSTFMTAMRSQLQTMLAAMTSTNGFGNYSGMFRNMTSLHTFWNYTGGHMQPAGGIMGGSGMMGRDRVALTCKSPGENTFAGAFHYLLYATSATSSVVTSLAFRISRRRFSHLMRASFFSLS